MMKKILLILALAAPCVPLIGCAGGPIGPSLSYASVLALEPKLSAQGDVLSLLGPPMRSDARTWRYESAQFPKGGSERRTLKVDFGADLKVQNYRWTFEGAGTRARKMKARSALKAYLKLRSRKCTPRQVARKLGIPDLATPEGMVYKIRDVPEAEDADAADCRLVFTFKRTRFLAHSLYVNRGAPVLLETVRNEKGDRVDDERDAWARFGPPALIADGTRWFWRLENGKLLNIDFDANQRAFKRSVVPVAESEKAAAKSALRLSGMKKLFRR